MMPAALLNAIGYARDRFCVNFEVTLLCVAWQTFANSKFFLPTTKLPTLVDYFVLADPGSVVPTTSPPFFRPKPILPRVTHRASRLMRLLARISWIEGGLGGIVF